MSLTGTAQRAEAAYGGAERWLAATAVEAVVSASGLLFWLKGHRPFRRLRVRAEVRAPRTRFAPLDSAGNTAVLDGHTARIEAPGGRTLAERPEARRFFPGGRRRFYWDRLDHAYFTGYALWNYLTLPVLLLREDLDWRELAPGVLEARFPPELPTHCAIQRFTFDEATGLLRQHDYTADVIGAWARAANVVLAHGRWEGLPFPARRRVTPRRADGRPRTHPTLVDITFHEWRLV